MLKYSLDSFCTIASEDNSCQSSILPDHRCKVPGCGTVLVLDGNQKNRRDICAATHSGWIEFEGLPGSICSGCQLSPAYRSHYCQQHSPRVCVSEGDRGLVKRIVDKKETRNSVMYKVNPVIRKHEIVISYIKNCINGVFLCIQNCTCAIYNDDHNTTLHP